MSEPRKAKVAFVGCGGFTNASIFPCLPMVPQLEVVAVCDLMEEKAKAASRLFNACPVYTDMHKMLDEIEVDGVFSIGPAPTQHEVAPQIMKRGLPVYVEKPSANNSTDAMEMVKIAEDNGVWGQVGFMKRFAPAYRMAQNIMAKPEFGQLNMVHCKWGQGAYPQIWGIDSAQRAFLIGQCCHLMDLIRYFGGDIATVQTIYREAPQNPEDPKVSTRIAYLTNVTFQNGAIGQFELSCMETGSFRDLDEKLELISMENVVIVHRVSHVNWRRAQDWDDTPTNSGWYSYDYDSRGMSVRSSHAANGYVGEVEHFAKRLLGEVDKGISGDLMDSVKSLQIGEAIYESAMNGGKTVEVKHGR
ncbi:MAG: Gfo/Idh/MocA family oxidoreductase [Armatimonadia bacterium]